MESNLSSPHSGKASRRDGAGQSGSGLLLIRTGGASACPTWCGHVHVSRKTQHFWFQCGSPRVSPGRRSVLENAGK